MGQTTWDLKNDYMTNTNPNGAWTYGQFTGSGFSPLAWDSGTNSYGTAAENQTFIYQNTGGSLAYGIAPGEISLEGDWGTPVARWTAPVSDTYTVTVALGGTTESAGGGYGNNFAQFAGLRLDGSDVGGGTFASNVMSWSFTQTLNAGETLDAFVLNPGNANGGNTETHFSVTGTVPEPASIACLGLGVVALIRRRRTSGN